MTGRRRFTPEFKARIVLEILTEDMSLAQASRKYKIKDSVLSRWRQEFIEQAPLLFGQGQSYDGREEQIAELERMVGRLAMELDAAKKLSRRLK